MCATSLPAAGWGCWACPENVKQDGLGACLESIAPERNTLPGEQYPKEEGEEEGLGHFACAITGCGDISCFGAGSAAQPHRNMPGWAGNMGPQRAEARAVASPCSTGRHSPSKPMALANAA